jgi:hypothetical protein
MRYIGPGTVETWFCAEGSIADPAAPTATELNAEVDLTVFVTLGGVNLPQSGTTVDASDQSTKQRKTVGGMYGGDQGSVTFHRDKTKASDTAWSTLPVGTVGFFAIPPRGLATAGTWAIGDAIDLYPIEVISRNPANLNADNETQRFVAEVSIPDAILWDFDLAA